MIRLHYFDHQLEGGGVRPSGCSCAAIPALQNSIVPKNISVFFESQISCLTKTFEQMYRTMEFIVFLMKFVVDTSVIINIIK